MDSFLHKRSSDPLTFSWLGLRLKMPMPTMGKGKADLKEVDEDRAGALWEEADILTKKPTGRFCCFYHVGTRLVDPENAIKALKSLVPYLAILRRASFSVCW